jgi:hypothetical protein
MGREPAEDILGPWFQNELLTPSHELQENAQPV